MSQGIDRDQVTIKLRRDYFVSRGPFTNKTSKDRSLEQSEKESAFVKLVVDIPKQFRSKKELEELLKTGQTLEAAL